ncbi:MAG: alpha/beta hydrolase [Lachnospiraceae bacterium]|nr:alpha/beta hydrolase [Lachnospiraceae bacterium]
MEVIKEELWFDSRDGETSLYAAVWKPDTDPVAVVQIIHGMNEYIDRYDRFARFLAAQGFYVTGEDHLGHGRSVPEGGTFGYFTAHDPVTVLVRDIHRLKKLTQEKFPGVPYYILGHSMGSLLLRNYLQKYGTGINGALIMGTGTESKLKIFSGGALIKLLTLIKGDKYVSKKVVALTFGGYLSHIEQPGTMYDWVTGDETELEKYVNDPLCTGFTFTLNGFGALVEMSRRMQDKKLMEQLPKKLPILILSGTEDPVGAWGRDPQELYDTYINMDMTKTAIKLYPGLRHEILNEKERDKVFDDILHWLRQQIHSV